MNLALAAELVECRRFVRCADELCICGASLGAHGRLVEAPPVRPVTRIQPYTTPRPVQPRSVAASFRDLFPEVPESEWHDSWREFAVTVALFVLLGVFVSLFFLFAGQWGGVPAR